MQRIGAAGVTAQAALLGRLQPRAQQQRALHRRELARAQRQVQLARCAGRGQAGGAASCGSAQCRQRLRGGVVPGLAGVDAGAQRRGELASRRVGGTCLLNQRGGRAGTPRRGPPRAEQQGQGQRAPVRGW